MKNKKEFNKLLTEMSKTMKGNLDKGLKGQRDKARIKRMLRLIERIWKKSSGLRLCQLIENCFNHKENETHCIYYKRDDELEKRLREVYKKELGE